MKINIFEYRFEPLPIFLYFPINFLLEPIIGLKHLSAVNIGNGLIKYISLGFPLVFAHYIKYFLNVSFSFKMRFLSDPGSSLHELSALIGATLGDGFQCTEATF